ncbi:MAG: DUF4358 domain-containing protein [Clostridia bacterium]|nr:DUF4358 domain-containing protein [Clostridia bacterium]
MKRSMSILWIAVTLLSLTGCTQRRPSETDMTPEAIADAIVESQQGLPTMRQIGSEDAEFDTWLSDCYGVRPECVSGGAIRYADGVEASEIAVFALKEERNAGEVEKALAEYIQRRADVFEGYAPQQAALARNGRTVINGRYVALLISPDPSAAREKFLECFEEGAENRSGGAAATTAAQGTETPSEPVADQKSYDPAAVLRAWKTGDDSSLNEINRGILAAAKDVIHQETDERMSDYEKELAIHDWITGWSRFDMSAFSHAPGDGESDSDSPYGVLIRKTGNCWGYSSTFQLFMDMLDIECITVRGTPNSSGVEHAWNMVRLEGDWYCVDTAWDDPIGGSPGHTYFNVTSDDLREGSIHRWDGDSVPEATGTTYAYGNP